MRISEREAVELYFKSCEGTLSQEECQLLEEMYPSNGSGVSGRERFDTEMTARIRKGFVPSGLDKMEIWNSIEQRFRQKKRPVVVRSLMFKVASVAAVVCFLLGGTTTWLLTQPQQEPMISKVIAPVGQKTQVVLPDGSVVWLNTGSELTYTTDFAKAERRVKMTGEGYFEVAKDRSKKFVVEMDEVSVVVLGTTFNARSRSNLDKIEVSLRSGKVAIERTTDHALLTEIAPNQQILIDRNNLSFEVKKCISEDDCLWACAALEVNSRRLTDVAHLLSKWYGVPIDVEEGTEMEASYTFRVTNETLDEILRLIGKITPIECVKENNNTRIIVKQGVRRPGKP